MNSFTTANPGQPLVKASGLRKRFPVAHDPWSGRQAAWHQAVDDVSLDLRRGEILGLVGESGSGKSTLGRLLLGLIPADAGQIVVAGRDLAHLDRRSMAAHRRSAQIVFQNPLASLDPRQRIGRAFREVLAVHGLPAAEVAPRITESLERVGLSDDLLDRLPRSFSGGQLQRIAIARALLVRPAFLVADEPVSSLDVSVQAQVLRLFAELRDRLGLGILFISHDLRATAWLADRIAVMYGGRIVETGPSAAVFGKPVHEHTRSLLTCYGPLAEEANHD